MFQEKNRKQIEDEEQRKILKTLILPYYYQFNIFIEDFKNEVYKAKEYYEHISNIYQHDYTAQLHQYIYLTQRDLYLSQNKDNQKRSEHFERLTDKNADVLGYSLVKKIGNKKYEDPVDL